MKEDMMQFLGQDPQLIYLYSITDTPIHLQFKNGVSTKMKKSLEVRRQKVRTKWLLVWKY